LQRRAAQPARPFTGELVMVSDHDIPPPGDRINPQTTEPSPAAAFGYAFEQFAEARDYFKFYLRARAELLRLAVRNFLFVSILTISLVVLAAALLVTAIVQVARGVAEGLAVLFGGHVWFADLLTGLAMLILFVAAIYGTIVKISSSWKKKTFSAYAADEHRRRAAAEETKVP
jgi:hypothetical protein